MINKNTTKTSGFIIILIIITFVSGYFLKPKEIKELDTKFVPSDIKWKTYHSSRENVTFEYPETWTVTDGRTNDSSELEFRICPSILQKNDNYCIEFFPKERLLNPRIGIYGDRNLFSEFNMEPYQYDYGRGSDNRSINFNYEDSKDNFTIGLKGFYRQEKDKMIGLYQVLCTEGKFNDCLFIFKHVLDSIKL